MKDLMVSVNEIMSGKGNKAYKREELKKLGLMGTDIVLIEEAWVKANPKEASSRVALKYTWGIELECFNVDRIKMQQLARAKGINLEYQGYNHHDSHTVYKMVSDASIDGENSIECVSPILKNNKSGFDSAKVCCDALLEVGAKVNKSTGYHVHFGVEGMTDEWYINIFKNYQMCEAAIDTFMPRSRRANNAYYCRSMVGLNFSGCTHISDVERVCAYDRNASHARYHKVNPCAWGRHRTIEFRQHSGTVEYAKVYNWVKFLAALIAYSKKNVLTSSISTLNEIPFIKAEQKEFYKARVAALN